MRPAIDTCADSRAPLLPIGSLMTCTVSDWPSKICRSIGVAAASPRPPPLAGRRVQVGHVQEGGAVQPDVDERALHAGQHARHLAQIDVADQAAFERAFDVQLLHRAVFDDGHARFLRGPVDEDVLVGHAFLCPEGRLRPSRPQGGQVQWRSHMDLESRARPRRPAQQLRRLVQRQPHDAGVAAVDVRHPGRDRALDGIGAGLAEGLAAGDVGRDRAPRHGAKRTCDTCSAARVRRPSCTATAVSTRCVRPDSAPQHGGGLGRVGRLAQDAPAQRHRGVGAQHRRRRQAALRQALARSAQLQPRHALHVGGGQLAGPHRLQRLGVFVVVGQQQSGAPRRSAAATGCAAGSATPGRRSWAALASFAVVRVALQSATRRGTAPRPAARARRHAAASGPTGAASRRRGLQRRVQPVGAADQTAPRRGRRRARRAAVRPAAAW